MADEGVALRKTCVSDAIEIARVQGHLSPVEILMVANKIYEYVKGGTLPPATTPVATVLVETPVVSSASS